MSSTTAWIFPGQGSQFVGMGADIARISRAARETFEVADQVLGFSLSSYCWNGSENRLTETALQQPAILATSIAMLRAAEELGSLPPPRYLAGHSLGQYSAMVAANALDFEDALKLVRRRGELMEEHARGGMVAVLGLDDEVLRVIASETDTEVANFNSPGQTTLSGSDAALKAAEVSAQSRGARRVVRLPVNAAFHSSLMEPVTDLLREEIERTEFRDPKAAVISNIDAQPLEDADGLRRELIEHITRSVQWMQSMEYMIGSGAREFVEIGPGNVLAGLARRIDRSVRVCSVNDLIDSNGG